MFVLSCLHILFFQAVAPVAVVTESNQVNLPDQNATLNLTSSDFNETQVYNLATSYNAI